MWGSAPFGMGMEGLVICFVGQDQRDVEYRFGTG